MSNNNLKYSIMRNPDICCKCGKIFVYEKCVGILPFYTIVERCRIKRICPDCFPKYKHLWMAG